MRFSQLAFVVLANLLGATAICHQSLHHSAAEINLVKGAERGTATLPLHTATLDDAEDDKPSRTIYFALIDASDEEFCKEYECVPSPKLIGAPDDSMELDATFVAGAWTFHHDPGTVTTSDTSRAISNPSYSPLKKISWEGQTVVVNVPFVKWGDAPNQQMLIDGDGCINEIRRNRPNPFFVGGGPPIGPGYDCPNERPQDRYKGGQLLALNVDAMTFTIKLHNSFHVFPYELPHYVVFENSKLAAAEGTGVIHAPRLTNLGDSVAQAPLFQFANGVPVRGGGPGRFQPGLTSYKGGVCNYVPMWLINWFFFDCDRDHVFNGLHNAGDCASCDPDNDAYDEDCCPIAGENGDERYDPLIIDMFDPFQEDDKNIPCRDFAIHAINDDGRSIVRSIEEARQLVQDGYAYLTRAPPGLGTNSTLQPDLYVNCPVLLTLKGNTCFDGHTWLDDGEADLDFADFAISESQDIRGNAPKDIADSNKGGQNLNLLSQASEGLRLLLEEGSGSISNGAGQDIAASENADGRDIADREDGVGQDVSDLDPDTVNAVSHPKPDRGPRPPRRSPTPPESESTDDHHHTGEPDEEVDEVYVETIKNAPMTCNGRDDECRKTSDGDVFCDYTFHLTQKATMNYHPTGFPYKVNFPVFTRDVPGEDWAELYYKECLHDMYLHGENTTDGQLPCEEKIITRDDPQFIGTDGIRRRVSVINEMIPGPTICANVGDIIRVNLFNDNGGFGYEAASVHWHGMFQRGTPWMDGVVYSTQCPVAPGAHYQYEFKCEPSGTFWWHSHSGVQIADGVFGTLICQNDDETEAAIYDTTFDTDEPDQILFVHDWEHENYQTVMVNNPGHWIDVETGDPVPNPESQDGQFSAVHPYASGLINGHGDYHGNNMKPYVFKVTTNKRIRFRMISASAMFAFRVSVDDHQLTVISIDGLDIQHVTVDGIIIFTAERYDFIVETNNALETNFWIRAETLSNDGEIKAILHYEDGNDVAPPTTTSVFESKCISEDCLVMNCPWPEKYSDNERIKCTNLGDLRRNRDQEELRNPTQTRPDVDEAIRLGNIIYLNFNILGSDGSMESPNVNGIINVLPDEPPIYMKKPLETIRSLCPKGSEGSFEKCTHVQSLNHDEPYLFVMTNRWPSSDDITSGRNFAGVQPHPVHMHGHSFYIVDHSAGTYNHDGLMPGTHGCADGRGNCDHSEYCFDQATLDGTLACDDYWGNCTFAFSEWSTQIPIDQAPQKDTVAIPTHGYIIVAIQSDNPGWWIMHCHLDTHIAQGMVLLLQEAEDEYVDLFEKELPYDYPSCGSLIIPSVFDP